jgi:hypothetical protein
MTSPIVERAAPIVLRLFAAHAMHQATLWQINEIGLDEAVGELRVKALKHRLVERFGRQEIEWIIGRAFEEVGVHYSRIRPKEGCYP